jgi:hypothetical protein
MVVWAGEFAVFTDRDGQTGIEKVGPTVELPGPKTAE